VDLARLIRLLSDPTAYPHPCGEVQVCQTHISAVFLAGPYAYKIKKPADLGFLDFTTLGRRHHFCLEEVRLNRRLAPRTYLGVVPVALHEGRLAVDGEGEAVEWAVWMERLPDDARLLSRLRRGEVTPGLVAALGERVAAFHRRAEAGPHVSRFGAWEFVARNARENFEQSEALVGTAASGEVHARAHRHTEDALESLRPLVDERAARGVPRDTHGDLHLDHVYVFPERPSPDDLVVVDCIEFNERFRYGDPVSDAAFLAMDLRFEGRGDLAARFAEAYTEASRDGEAPELFPFYAAYRAAVRAKVEGFRSVDPQVSGTERAGALESAQAHWLLALGLLAPPAERPCLVAIGGLPGTGKSTLARGLGERAGFTVISTDRVRKELAGLDPESPAPAAFGGGIYAPEWTERTYAECLRRAEGALFEGRRVVLDGTFREERWRRRALACARRRGVPGLVLLCAAAPEAVRRRIAARRGGPSDADWEVYRAAAARWEEPGPETRERTQALEAGAGSGELLGAALDSLRSEALA
jgi:aminoglycoside phosphotransferase family enzyme/predicted kinase